MVSIDAETGTDGGTLDLPDTGESPERALMRGERARYLHDAIRALPDRLDEVVERNFFDDESLTDIATDLGVTLSRVSQMRARALTLLHAAMSEIWEGRPVPADGGVRARNQQRGYVDRVAAARAGSRRAGRSAPRGTGTRWASAARTGGPTRLSDTRARKSSGSPQVQRAPRRNTPARQERPAARMQRDHQ